jgi:hypothetical protein
LINEKKKPAVDAQETLQNLGGSVGYAKMLKA